MSDMICSGCGSPLSPGANFCADCGTAVAVVQEPGQFYEESAVATEPMASTAATPGEAPIAAAVSAAPGAPLQQGAFTAASVGTPAFTAAPALAMAAGPVAAAAPAAAAPSYSRPANPPPMSVIGYLITMLAFSIPIVGLVVAFLWAFGQNASLNRRNFARAQIIIWALILLLVVLVFIFGGDSVTTNFDFNIG